jgi:hypothetical protein
MVPNFPIDWDTAKLKAAITENAAEVRRLHARIHETLSNRGTKKGHDEWKASCREFHARYDELAFPAGYDDAATRILAGDPLAVEAALCFLELRPYFFRSGYMYKALLPKVKRAPLSPEQAVRLQVVLQRHAAWRAEKTKTNASRYRPAA